MFSLCGRVALVTGASRGLGAGIARTLARTAAPHGVTVNAIAPGIVETELLYQTHGAQGVNNLAAVVPLGLGQVGDVSVSPAYHDGAPWATLRSRSSNNTDQGGISL